MKDQLQLQQDKARLEKELLATRNDLIGLQKTQNMNSEFDRLTGLRIEREKQISDLTELNKTLTSTTAAQQAKLKAAEGELRELSGARANNERYQDEIANLQSRIHVS
jgi:hypothetical protein